MIVSLKRPSKGVGPYEKEVSRRTDKMEEVQKRISSGRVSPEGTGVIRFNVEKMRCEN